MGATLLSLLKKQPPYVKSHAETVRVTKIVNRVVPTTGMPAVVAHTFDIESGNKGHVCQIVSIPSKKTKSPTSVKEGHVKVSCDCVSGNTRVLTDSGWKKILDIAEEANFDKMPISYIVNGKIFKGTAPYHAGFSDTFRLVASNGNKIEATKDHKFQVEENKKLHWKKLQELKVGDNLVVSAHAPLDNVDAREFREGFVLGILMGANQFTKKSGILLLPASKEYCLDLLAVLKVGILSKKRDANNLIVQFDHYVNEITSRYNFKYERSVNLQTDSQIYGYLSGLINMRGNFVEGISIYGRNHCMVQAQYFCHQIGFGLTTLNEMPFDKNSNDTSKGYKLSFDAREFYKLKNIILLDEKSQKIVDEIISNSVPLQSDEIPTVKVESIGYCGKQNVYDITVDSVSSFVANNFIVHNCDFFKYYCEYPLTQWGAANIRHSNGEPASFTNPTNYPLLCIAKGQLVDTEHGKLPIEEILVGTKVKTFNGYKTVLAAQKTGEAKEILKVETENSSLLCTPEHEIFAILNSGNFGWVAAKELSKPFSSFYVVDGSSEYDSSKTFPILLYKFLIAYFSQNKDAFAIVANISDTQNDSLMRFATKDEILKYLKPFPKNESVHWMLETNWKFVKGVSSAGVSDVFDITVEEAHCFYASDFLVHNCKHLYTLGKKVYK